MSRHQLALPEKVHLGDITTRDGLQPLEHYFSTAQKIRLLEDLIDVGFKHVEATNFGHPRFLPQFKDAEEVLDGLFQSERVGAKLKQNGGDVTVMAITINERACDRALEYKAKRGFGPDYVLQMVSTDEAHHRVNSGMSIDEYFTMSARCIEKAHAADTRFCGTVSTIWGSPILESRVTSLDTALEYSRRYLDLGADYIEQADHDGSADPQRVYEYFSKVLDPDIMGKWADPKYHLAHFHTSRGMGLANVLAALQAGITRFESTLSSTGGQPANTVDGLLIGGTGQYYHFEHLLSGLVSTEDLVVMLEAMGVHTGIDIPGLLALGKRFRDDYLRITPEHRARLIENVSKSSGLPVAQLETLSRSTDDLDALIDAAVSHHTAPGEEPNDNLRANMEMLLRSTATYLRSGTWCHSRSETLIAGVPPSPRLAEILD